MNLRPLPPQGSALPTAPHPDDNILYYTTERHVSQEFFEKNAARCEKNGRLELPRTLRSFSVLRCRAWEDRRNRVCAQSEVFLLSGRLSGLHIKEPALRRGLINSFVSIPEADFFLAPFTTFSGYAILFMNCERR